jgi:hypothetical protein
MPWKNSHKFYWRSPLFKENFVNPPSQKRILFVDVTVCCTCSDNDSPRIQVYFGALLGLEDQNISNTSKQKAKAGAIYVQSPMACTHVDLQTYASQLQIELEDTPPSGLANLMAKAFLSLQKNHDRHKCEEDGIVVDEERLKDGTLNLNLVLQHEDLGQTRLLISNGINDSEWERTDGYIGKVALDMFIYNLDPVNQKKEDNVNEEDDENESSSVMTMFRKWWELAWNYQTTILSKFNSGLDATHDRSSSSTSCSSSQRKHESVYPNIHCDKSPESISHSLVSSNSSLRSLTPSSQVQKGIQPSEASLSPLPQETQGIKPIVRHRKIMHGRVRGNARPRKKGSKLKFRSIKD